MKEEGTLLVLGSLLTFSLTTVIPTHAAGTLGFADKVINESYQIANNDGDVNIDLDNVDISALKSHGTKTAEAPFTINLTGCPLAQNISINLEGTPDTNANGTSAAVLTLSDVADTAKGVGIEAFSSPDGSTKGTQLTFDKQSRTAVSRADENGDIALNFIADLENDSSLDVTADGINATANTDIVYEQNMLITTFTEGSIPCPYFHSS